MIIYYRIYIFFAVIVLFFFQPLHAFRSRFIVTDEPKEDLLLNDFNNVTLIEAALAASGIPEINFARYTAEFKRWESEIRASLPREAAQYQIAEIILNYIHKNVFSRYKLESTTLAEVFNNGEFNCLSSTIVNGILLQAFGIEVKGVVLPTHVYLLAVLDGKPTEIENTIAQGLLISQDKRLQDQFNSLTGFSYGNNTQKVVVSWGETTGLLYSNRSYFNAQRNEFEQSFQNMMKAQALLAKAPSEQSNLTAGYLNYSYYIYQKETRPLNEYLRTMEILQEGISRYPNYQVLKGNYLRGVDIVLQRMISNGSSKEEIDTFITASKPYLIPSDYEKVNKGRFFRQIMYYMRDKKDMTASKDILLTLLESYPRDKDVQTLSKEFFYLLVQNDVKNNTYLAPNQEILNTLKLFPLDITGEYFGQYYSELARGLYARKKIEEAVTTMEEGLASVGRQRLITENGFAYAVNAAQNSINQKDFEPALTYYKRALVFKNSSQVINNMAIIYENLAIQSINNNNNKAQAKRWVSEGLSVSPNNKRLLDLSKQL